MSSWQEASTWVRLAPSAWWQGTVLERWATWLEDTDVQAAIVAHERAGTYPRDVLEGLQRRGLAALLVDDAKGPTALATMPHACTLNALSARVNGSLAITLGVNFLALLPMHVAGTEAQWAYVAERVRAGALCGLALTELPHGSNLLRNETRADPDGDGYRLVGEKHMINGAREHDLLFVLARTKASSGAPSPLAARGDMTLLLVDRDGSVEALPRWQTMPMRAADIGSLRFHGTRVPKERAVGGEGAGFPTVQQALLISRGGIGALASGLSSAAFHAASTYASVRNVYGAPIVTMDVMAEHLARMAALDALVAATALKAAVWVNALGPGAAHATAVAKYACTVMAEEAVTEGRRLFGSRALVAEYDYERLVRDVTLYPVFDGTAHVMLDQLQWRLAQFASQGNHDGDSLAFARAAYTGPPRHLSIAARERGRPYLVSIAQRLGAWRSHEAGNDVEPYARAAEVLLAVVRSLRDGNVWEERQSLRFEAGDMLARLEAIAALLELGNGPRRAALGIARPLHGADDVFARFAAPWMGARIVSCMEQWVKEHRIPRPPALDGLMDAMVEPLGTARSEAYAVLRQNVAAEGCT